MTSTVIKHQARLQKWVAAVQECRSSGLSVRQWCKQREITPTTYYRWEREVLSIANMAREATQEPAIAFVELPTPKQKNRNIAERVVTIHINDDSIDIYGTVDHELLKSMVEALRSC